MSPGLGVVTWLRGGPGPGVEDIINTYKVYYNFLFLNGEKIGRMDSSCSVVRQGTQVKLAWENGCCASLALHDPQDVEKICAAALRCSGKQAARASAARCSGQLAAFGLPWLLTARWKAPMPDFGGRLAELLWAPEPEAVLSSQGLKRRRVAPSYQSLWRLMSASRGCLKDLILGIKERRSFIKQDVDSITGFNRIVESTQERFPREWTKLRPLQNSSTNEEDKKVARAVLKRHMEFEPSPTAVSRSPKK